mmetsp:Transcript_16853/g.25369  ORF Transcript_16853/g.25369 Transcript_16853/m.25369 type:complete len:251 (+) Transcript_16853:34-786(+)
MLLFALLVIVIVKGYIYDHSQIWRRGLVKRSAISNSLSNAIAALETEAKSKDSLLKNLESEFDKALAEATKAEAENRLAREELTMTRTRSVENVGALKKRAEKLALSKIESTKSLLENAKNAQIKATEAIDLAIEKATKPILVSISKEEETKKKTQVEIDKLGSKVQNQISEIRQNADKKIASIEATIADADQLQSRARLSMYTATGFAALAAFLLVADQLHLGVLPGLLAATAAAAGFSIYGFPSKQVS